MRSAVAVVVMLVVAACGGEDEPPATSMPSTTRPASVTSTTQEQQAVSVFFGIESPLTCEEVTEYRRNVPAAADPIGAAFVELLAGPTPEEIAAGARSWFSEDTAGMLRSAEVADGELTVDFDNFATVIPNASTSCGSAELLAELTHTAFQFEEVEAVEFTFEGSCEVFGEFLQMGCVRIAREDPGSDEILYRATPDLVPPGPLAGGSGASGSGCAPGSGSIPDGVWFGIAEQVDTDTITFDLACFFFGEAADEAAAEDGFEEIPVPNDYWIRNAQPTARSVPMSDTVVFHTLGVTIEDGFEAVSLQEWLAADQRFVPCPGESCLVWLYVNGGQATEVVEQYTP